MKCPNCNYEHGSSWDENDEYVFIDGEKGAFFELSNGIMATRKVDWSCPEEVNVHGCPKCGMFFMEVN